MESSTGSITRWLNGRPEASGGDPELVSRLYESLCEIARVQRAKGRGADLATGDLVHEAYLKLFVGEERSWRNRAHFFGTAALAMQQVLVDLWRRDGVRRRHRKDLAVRSISDGASWLGPDRVDELVRLLDAYAAVESEGAEVVRLRFFTGLPMRDVAEMLGIPLRTAQRRYFVALGWLSDRLK